MRSNFFAMILRSDIGFLIASFSLRRSVLLYLFLILNSFFFIYAELGVS